MRTMERHHYPAPTQDEARGPDLKRGTSGAKSSRRLRYTMKIAKSLTHKLGDLEDHLFLLANSLDGLDSGQTAHLRQLAAELRVLICYSSGTEGLLWRVANEMAVSDDVEIHQVGNVDPDHPLSKGLEYCFVPIAFPGHGDERLPVETYPLKEIIKEDEAIFVAGRGVTHERLIKWLSQQIGSAHEGDKIDEIIAKLNSILINKVQIFFRILYMDALLTLIVGERVLCDAVLHKSYSRNHRNFQVDINAGKEQLLNISKSIDAPTVEEETLKEGSLFFVLNVRDKGWEQRGNHVTFPSHKYGKIHLEATKTAGNFLTIKLTGLSEGSLNFKRRLPTIGANGLSVVITWTEREVNLYLNGKISQKVPR